MLGGIPPPFEQWSNLDPANNYLFKVNNRNTRKSCEICSKLTLTTRSGTVSFEHISHLFLFLLLTLSK